MRENRFKLYFFDVGLLGAASGIAPATFLNYDFGSYQGYVAENFVAQELRAAEDKTLFCISRSTRPVVCNQETPEPGRAVAAGRPLVNESMAI